MAFINVALALSFLSQAFCQQLVLLAFIGWPLFCVLQLQLQLSSHCIFHINHGNFGGALVTAGGQNNSIANCRRR